MNYTFTFADLFSGIGGFHLGLSQLGGNCVVACDINTLANENYEENFGIKPLENIRELPSRLIPNFDILCAGFPCQSFSRIGQKKGLNDPRGEVVHEIFRILRDKQPKAFILENVKGLLTHNKGKTLDYIIKQLKFANYKVYNKVLEAKDFGLPQLRKRLFIVGIQNHHECNFTFPEPLNQTQSLSDILQGQTERDYAFTIRCGGRHSGINNKYNWDCYMVDGKPRYLTVEECLLLQGFPSDFLLTGSKTQKFKLVGNSVPVPIVKAIGKQLVELEIFNY